MAQENNENNNEEFVDAAAGAVIFSLTPARVTNDILNYASKHGASIWKSSTSPLDPDNKFDCTPEGLRDFLELVQQRGKVHGWDTSVLSIPNDAEELAGAAKDFVSNYGSIDLEHIKVIAATYVNTQSRAAQDSFALYTCLSNSLSDIGRNKVTVHKALYKVGDTEAGILFLKLIVQESAIDTNATTMSLRNQLTEIHTYIATVDYDIVKTNGHVQLLLEALQARGETTTDLLNNLFKAYKTVKDAEFLRWVKQKESDYEEGSLQNFTPTKFMAMAQTKYKTLADKGEWQAPTPEEEKIVALQTELRTLKREQNKKGKTEKKGAKEKSGKANPKKKPSEKKDDAWRYEKPKEGEPTKKTVKGKDWYFCPNHEKWCRHKPSACEGKGVKKDGSKSSEKKGGNPKLVQAQQATLRFQDDDSDEE